MKAGDYDNTMGFHCEDDAVGEAPHSRAPSFSVHDREAPGVFDDGLDGGHDRQRELLAQSRTLVLDSRRWAAASGIQ